MAQKGNFQAFKKSKKNLTIKNFEKNLYTKKYAVSRYFNKNWWTIKD